MQRHGADEHKTHYNSVRPSVLPFQMVVTLMCINNTNKMSIILVFPTTDSGTKYSVRFEYSNNHTFGSDKLRPSISVWTICDRNCTDYRVRYRLLLLVWFSAGFGNVDRLDTVNFSPADVPMLCAVIAWIVQFFYAFRIYMLRKSFLWISIVIASTSLTQLAAGLVTGHVLIISKGFQLGKFSRFHDDPHFNGAYNVWIISSIVCDVVVAGSLTWLLFKSRKENPTRGASDRILSRLVYLVVQTNALTTVMAVVSFIGYSILPNSMLFACTTYIMGKLYSNALLATMNNRIISRRIELDDIVFQDLGSLLSTTTSKLDPIAPAIGNPLRKPRTILESSSPKHKFSNSDELKTKTTGSRHRIVGGRSLCSTGHRSRASRAVSSVDDEQPASMLQDQMWLCRRLRIDAFRRQGRYDCSRVVLSCSRGSEKAARVVHEPKETRMNTLFNHNLKLTSGPFEKAAECTLSCTDCARGIHTPASPHPEVPHCPRRRHKPSDAISSSKGHTSPLVRISKFIQHSLLTWRYQIIGTLFNWGLFGVLSTQVYVYYLGFPDDRIRNKVLGRTSPVWFPLRALTTVLRVVYGVYLLEVVQTAMTADDLCFWFARGFGDMDNLDRVNLSPWDAPMMCSIIAWTVQCFYSFRIYMLRKSFVSVSILILLTWFITRIICDALIAATLLWLLLKSRKENASNGKGAQILARLVHLIVQTNALTGSFTFSFLFHSREFGITRIISCYGVGSGYQYSNALLATLNNRIIARKLEMDDIVFRDSHSLLFYLQSQLISNLCKSASSREHDNIRSDIASNRTPGASQIGPQTSLHAQWIRLTDHGDAHKLDAIWCLEHPSFFPDDNMRNKILVYTLYLVEATQTVMTAVDLCSWFATGFGNMNRLDDVNLSPADTPILCGIIALIVQCFYAFRIYMLRKSLVWVSIIVVLTSLIQLAAGLACGYYGFKLHKISRFRGDLALTQFFHVWMISDIVCDVLVAVTLIWLLISKSSGLMYPDT
ncbi:LOW QUALITY PROTEIN: hypothetical protein CVT26_009236 [Gymnopilus dilepis]|uniref:DUF6534 domain-containing protein n=1 Tax=Gymnopilus dilepis TaxID=231916 RepID=A0A409YRP6_9AGAR|nr:LOW QUALITY PROTEIN: hypothetical protein CVT26_009236 [Gymnopilus dilepis]